MKKILLAFLCFLCANLSFGNVQLFVKPGANFYGDSIGYQVQLGAQANLNSLLSFVPTGLFGGVTIGMLGASLSNFSLLGESATLGLGYRFPITKIFIISPCFSAGGGHMGFRKDPFFAEKWFLSFMTSVEFEILLNKNFSLGMDVGYNFFTLDVYNGGLFNLSLKLSYLFSGSSDNITKDNETNIQTNTIKEISMETNSSVIINLVKKPTRKYPAAEIQQMTVSEITALAKWAMQENESEHAKLLVKEGLVKEPDNNELLSLLTKLMTDK
jgi:hypothetical protein